MIKALFTSATGMNAQTTAIDNTSNNIANVNTTGFKKGQTDFQDLIYVNNRAAGVENAQGTQFPSGIQIGSGVQVAGITKVHSQGNLVNTGNRYDLAIQGDGFFQVTLPGTGELRYTRDGAFRLNSQGNLVTADGFLLSPQITIPNDALSVTIGVDGTVSVTQPGSTSATQVGQINIARFSNPSGLSAEGRNLYSQTDVSGTPTQSLQQNFLERSNVDVVGELVNLILAQRAYEFNTRAVRTSDNMLAATTDLIR
jgi:flagellar basal-body rod protein FlgG